ncbi:protein of unknown function [Lishizhenia tianjinensis]|uniref:DUF4294 domain-containing protein n=1 Tax=Lishizhenia tianjinensis TaxID=477690 RepID=A0A1I6YGU7_9FLAO|nr:DUF4294 domain-containing protein [Lishizhenia tianjinensis]SFT49537.1 protein of unknown function [Lishizhenia tianjinensis]
MFAKIKQLPIFLLFLNGVWAMGQQNLNLQEDTAFVYNQEFEEIKCIPNYQKEYNRLLRKVRKVYPLALYTKEVIDSLDLEMASLNKKRKQKKLVKQTHKDLKADFKFLLKDLYRSDGVVLAKLIYRETGMSIYDIISKYESESKASTFSLIAQAWDQDLKMRYDPEDKDYILERVIEDVNAGLVKFDFTVHLLDKSEYKLKKKAYVERRKEARKKNRQRRRQQRKKGTQ